MNSMLLWAMLAVFFSGSHFVLGTEKMHAELRFKALLSQGAIMEEHAEMKLQPCGTGMEVVTGILKDTKTTDECIKEVFAMTKVENLPATAMVPMWLGEKLWAESKNDTPWIRRFAIVLSTGASVVRQLLEPELFSQFTTTFAEFEGQLFRPSSAMTLKYMKSTVIKMMGAKIITALVDFVTQPCALIPDVGIAVFASINFQLSKWCKFGVTSILKRLLNLIITKAEPLIQGAAAQKPGLKCFQLDKLVKLLTGRLDQTYATWFDGSTDDLSKILKPECMVTVSNPPPKEPTEAPCCNKCQAAAPKKLRFAEVSSTALTDPGLTALVETQMRPDLLKAEIVKYGLLTLLESLVDTLFDGINEYIKKFISWTNKFLGAAVDAKM